MNAGSVVVAGEDNAATELVTSGVNGLVAKDAAAEAIPQAIVEVHETEIGLRLSMASWFAENAQRCRFEASLMTMLNSHAIDTNPPPKARA